MSAAAAIGLAPVFSPQGHLRLVREADAPSLPLALQDRLLAAFERGAGSRLLQLGTSEVGSVLPPVLAWWRDFAARFVMVLCAANERRAISFAVPDVAAFKANNSDVLISLWGEVEAAVRSTLAAETLTLQAFPRARHPVWKASATTAKARAR